MHPKHCQLLHKAPIPSMSFFLVLFSSFLSSEVSFLMDLLERQSNRRETSSIHWLRSQMAYRLGLGKAEPASLELHLVSYMSARP